jgi:hypothetical protein
MGHPSAHGWTGDDDFQRTFRAITLLHETSHYLHDLALGASLKSDFLLDESAVLLFDAMRESDTPISCPVTPGTCPSEPPSLRLALQSYVISHPQLPQDLAHRPFEPTWGVSEDINRLPSIVELEEGSVAAATQ